MICYDSFSRIINEPIDTIIRLNQKLNGDTGQYIPASERQSDVRELDDKASFLTDFILTCIIIYVRRLHKAERAMLADALKAKEAQQKKQ